MLHFRIKQLEKSLTTPARKKRAPKSDSGSSNKSNQPKKIVPSPPETSTSQTTKSDTKVKKVPAPEAITVYGVADFNKFQEAILNNHTEGSFYPVFTTLGNGTIQIKAACVESYRQILNLMKEMQEVTLTNNEQDIQALEKIEYHCYTS